MKPAAPDWALIQTIARKRARYYRGDREELASIGVLAIAERLAQFDPAKGSFRKWATYTADRAIAHACQERGLIRVPRRSREEARKAGTEHALPEVAEGVQLERTAIAAPDALEQLLSLPDRAALRQALAWLRRVERRVLELAFGLRGKPEAPEAIAQRLAVRTRQRGRQRALALDLDRVGEVRGIRARALAKLRELLDR